MDGDRWTSKWQPSDRNAGFRQDRWVNDRDKNANKKSDQHSRGINPATNKSDRWEGRWGDRGSVNHAGDTSPRRFRANGFRQEQQLQQPHPSRRGQTHGRRQPHSKAEWEPRGGPDAGHSIEDDIMGELYGGLDPGETAPRTVQAAGGWWSGSEAAFPSTKPCSSGVSSNNPDGLDGVFLRETKFGTLGQLEEAVARGEQNGWSLERLAEAATAMCEQVWVDPPGMDPSSMTFPLKRREEAVMDALAAVAVGFYLAPATLPPPPATTERAWAAAQLLWACARGQYWSGPPKPSAERSLLTSTTVPAASPAVTGPSTAAGPRPVPGDETFSASDNKGSAAGADKGAWAKIAAGSTASPAAASVAAAGPADGGSVADGPHAGSSGGACSSATAADAEAPSSPTGLETAGVTASFTSAPASTSTAAPQLAWRPLAVALLELLAQDDCRLVSQLDGRCVSLVWWALAKAASAARFRHGADGATVTAAAAARAALAAAAPALLEALETRAVETLRLSSTPQLCSLLYAGAAVGRSTERLVAALGTELAARLEEGLILGGGALGLGRGCFSARELSCVAYSYGLLGVRNEQLLSVLAEYVVTSSELKWSASSISVLMFGLANVGFRHSRLMDWADQAIAATPPQHFNLRNISFLLCNFHRLRWWPRLSARHLLGAVSLHPPPSIPVISISTILMCMGSARARDERALAHLCLALTRGSAGSGGSVGGGGSGWSGESAGSCMLAKDVCICLTALQRLHGEDVLASQQPEVLEALDFLTDVIVDRGFSRIGPGGHLQHVFNHQEVSNAMFALGKLKYYKPAVLRALREHAARGGLEGASAWDCTATLGGLANLNYSDREQEDWERAWERSGRGQQQQPQQPQQQQEDREQQRRRGKEGCSGAVKGPGMAGLDLVGMLAGVVAQRARTAKCQDLANTLWALTVMDGALHRYRSIVTTLVEEANRRGPASEGPDGFNVDEQRQIWQVHRELMALPEPYPVSLREDLVRLGRLGMSEADHTYSRVQATFQSVLIAMHQDGRFRELRDLLFEQELVPGGEQLMRIDVQAMVERPCPGGSTTVERVAVEFDGPFHFMVNEPYTARVDGRTALRNRILARHLGRENVVCVSMAEWVAASREQPRGMPGRWRLLATKMGLRC